MRQFDHTPLPWTFYRDEDGRVVAIVNDHENLSKRGIIVRPGVGNTRSAAENEANAAFIVTAANAYEANTALIAKLTEALEHIASLVSEGFQGPALDIANAALSLAKSETPQ